ncbi:MAG: hypothetical protein AcusKO_42280 [Acuticoccus sp.]
MKARLCVYLSDPWDQRLGIAARRPGASKSAITDAALAAFLSPERDDQRDAAIIRRLDRLSRTARSHERDLTIVSESHALFVRYYLTISPADFRRRSRPQLAPSARSVSSTLSSNSVAASQVASR